jgi:transposase
LCWIGAASGRRNSEEPPLLLPIVRQIPGEHYEPCGRQLDVIAGLAPNARDSGDHNEARHIRGGRAHVRKALYMAAVSAARFNPALKLFYSRLIAVGKKPKVALTAVTRKLVVLANTLLREDRPWRPNHP